MYSERVENKKQLYLRVSFHSLPGLELFQRPNSLYSGRWVHPNLTPQCRRSAGNLLGLKGCALVLSQRDVIPGCLLDGFKNARRTQAHPLLSDLLEN